MDNMRVMGAHNSSSVGSHSGPGSHYKVGGSKLKLGAATSTNFMKSQGAGAIMASGGQVHPASYNMSMLRSVQQNMPMMPNVSYFPFGSDIDLSF